MANPEINNIRVETVTAAGAKSASAVSTAKSAETISFKFDDDLNKKILEVINSDAYKNASAAEQKNMLSVLFPQNTPDEYIRNYLSTVSQMNAVTGGANKEKVEEQPLEQTEKNPKVEKQELEETSANSANAQESKKSNVELVSKEVLQSSEWKNKSFDEKLNIYMDAYLSENDTEYKNLSDKDKELYLKSKKDLFVKKTFPNLDKLSKVQQNSKFAALAKMLAVLNSQDISIDDYVLMDGRAITKSIKKYDEQIEESKLHKFQDSLVSKEYRQSDEWKNLSPEEKLSKYIDAYLTKKNPDYEKMSVEEKQAYAQTQLKEISKNFGIKLDFEKMSNAEKNEKFTQAAEFLDMLESTGVDLAQYRKMSPTERAVLMSKYKDSKDIPLNKTDKAEIKLIEEWKSINDNKEPTVADLRNLIKSKGKVSKEYQDLLEQYNFELKMNEQANSRVVKNLSIDDVQEALGYSRGVKGTKEYLENNITKDSSDKDIIHTVRLIRNPKALEVFREHLKALGKSDAEINKFIKSQVCANTANSAINADADNYNISINTLMDIKAPDSAKVASEYTPKYFHGEDFTKVALNTVQYEELIPSLRTGMSNRDWMSKEEDLAQSKLILNSSVIPDQNKTIYTKETILSVQPAEQLEFGREFAKLDNFAVTKGLAAAEKYVDSSVKSQYSAEVTSSVNRMQSSGKCTQAEADSINQTRQTGYTEAETQKITQTQNTISNSSSLNQVRLEAERQNEYQALVAKKQAVLDYAVKVIVQTLTPVVKKSDNHELEEEIVKLQNAKTPQEIKTVTDNIKGIVEKYQIEIIANQKAEALETEITEQEAVDAFVAELEDVNQESEKKYNLSAETIIEIKSAYSKGGLIGLFDKIVELSGVLGSDAQQKLLNYIAHTDSSTLHSFASAHSGDKAILLALYNNTRDPEILRLLLRLGVGKSLIGHNGITIKDFLAHADKDLVANWIADLAKTGSTTTLNSALEMLNDAQIANVKAKTKIITKDTKGGDDWILANNKQADYDDGIAISSNKVPMRGDYDRMKTKGPFYYSA
ncbi:hypothetical protein J6G99_03680 [bacterium]|nr:hypothetical protein [bacterium]